MKKQRVDAARALRRIQIRQAGDGAQPRNQFLKQPELILTFLDHLEQVRGNAVRTRNARLAALRAFLKFAGHRDVNALHVVEQALGVPMLGFLSREEMLAIIGKPGSSLTSQRDHLLLHMLYNRPLVV